MLCAGPFLNQTKLSTILSGTWFVLTDIYMQIDTIILMLFTLPVLKSYCITSILYEPAFSTESPVHSARTERPASAHARRPIRVLAAHLKTPWILPAYRVITKTCLCNVDPLKLEPPRRGGSNKYPQSVLIRTASPRRF